MHHGLEALWGSVHALTQRVLSVADRDTFLDDCLDSVVELVGANKGLIVLTDAAGTSYAVNARGSGRALSAHEREEVSRTIIRQVSSSGRSTRWEPDLEGGTPSAAAFGIAAALAAPIHTMSMSTGEWSTRGVVYLDFRDVRREINAFHEQFLDIAANLIGVVLAQSEKLAATEESLRAALATRPGEAPLPSLDEILRPRSMQPIRDELASALTSAQPIVITGESGTGKTLLARAIGEAAGRQPFVRATLGQSDDLNTISSELFGHHAGAFSGAVNARKGLVEFAHGGTLMLDEILNLPMPAQQLLLDFTQFGSYRPLGHNAAEPKYADVRIIAATNGSLEDAVSTGAFRQDLYYRLASIKLELPPLRERREDIAPMAESQLRRRDPGRSWTLSPRTRQLLVSASLPWPGNVRQLEAVIQRACERALAADANATVIEPEHVAPRDLAVGEMPAIGAAPAPAAAAEAATAGPSLDGIGSDNLGESWKALQDLKDQVADREREILTAALERHGRVVARAARELGLSRTSLVSRLNTFKIPHGRGE